MVKWPEDEELSMIGIPGIIIASVSDSPINTIKELTGGSKGDKNSKKIIHIGGRFDEDIKVIILEKPINVSNILKYNDSKIKSKKDYISATGQRYIKYEISKSFILMHFRALEFKIFFNHGEGIYYEIS